MNEINGEFIEKYNEVKELAEEAFPKHRWLIETVSWDDDTFIIQATHNRGQLGHGQWKACIKVGSEKARASSEPFHRVKYYAEIQSEEFDIVYQKHINE